MKIDQVEKKIWRAWRKKIKATPKGQLTGRWVDALSMSWQKRNKVFKARNNYFDPVTMRAVSYNWWTYVIEYKGHVIFNRTNYSHTTSGHQSTVSYLLRQLGIKFTPIYGITESLTPELFKTRALEHYYRAIFDAEIALNRRGARKENRKWRLKNIAQAKRDIKKLRALGAQYSKAQQMKLHAECIANEKARLANNGSLQNLDKEKIQKAKVQQADLAPINLEVFNQLDSFESVTIGAK